MKSKSLRTSHCPNVFQRKALALAIGGTIALAFGGSAYAQATNGTIYGTVPVAAGETIHITSSSSGFNRTITVGASGKRATPPSHRLTDLISSSSGAPLRVSR